LFAVIFVIRLILEPLVVIGSETASYSIV